MEEALTPTPESSRLAKTLRLLGWIGLAVFLVISFTLAKLPEDRIGQILLGQLNSQLQYGPNPMEVTAEQFRLSLLLTPSVRLRSVTLKSRDASGQVTRVRLDELRIWPSLVDLLMGRMGGRLDLTPHGSKSPSLSASGWFKSGTFSVQADFREADLGDAGLGILPLLARVGGRLPLNGTLVIAGNAAVPSSWSGNIGLQLGKVALPAQRIAGFPIPALNIQNGEIKAQIAASKAKIQSLRLGKLTDPSDDLSGTLAGEITLGRSLDSSQLALKIQLRISEAVLKAFFLIDALLGPAKTPDGSYAFDLNGPFFMPALVPSGGGK